MAHCPRCHQTIDSQAIACPYCRTALKAHGHPGIPLHRAEGNDYLCDTCTYHADETCNYPQRPYAKECTLYEDRFQPVAKIQSKSKGRFKSSPWQGNEGWLFLAGLAGIALLIALYK